MKFSKTTFAIIISIVLIIILGIFFYKQSINISQTSNKDITNPTSNESAIHSPYAGQEERGIKALSQNDVEGLLTGAGTPFGGMAKPAELNGYPGPRHVLDAFEAGEFDLTNEQHEQIEAIYEEMRSKAIELGKQIIDIEKEVDGAFVDKLITEEILQEKILESANLYGQLRIVHLKSHLSMVAILTSQQTEQYNELRGYVEGGNPCENIPEGHDSELWKMHNDCE